MVSTKHTVKHHLGTIVEHGQSVWLDYMTRSLVRDGHLQRLIQQNGLRGMTSNPTIFQKAIAAGNTYDEHIREELGAGKHARAIFEALAVRDVQDACDLFLPVYEHSDGQDGFVSIEVAPSLAHDTEGTIVEAHRLWRAINRPNVMIKVPGTDAGAPAIERLLREGVNVNITLLFSLQNHERVMWNYINALDARLAKGLPINRIASVASFFVSRVDTLVDQLLEAKIEQSADDPAQQERLRGRLGQAAIANAKLAYARFREIFDDVRFQRLKQHGARVQRVLWASTSTKNPNYSDVYYVENLIGPDTVNSMPLETIEAFLDHGSARRTIDRDVEAARATLSALTEVGIDYDSVTKQLEDEGVAKFAQSYDELIADIERKCAQMEHS